MPLNIYSTQPIFQNDWNWVMPNGCAKYQPFTLKMRMSEPSCSSCLHFAYGRHWGLNTSKSYVWVEYVLKCIWLKFSSFRIKMRGTRTHLNVFIGVNLCFWPLSGLKWDTHFRCEALLQSKSALNTFFLIKGVWFLNFFDFITLIFQ